MLFNSYVFWIFFLAVFALYSLNRRLRWQNSVLLVASYVSYGFWDWRFLGLLFVSTVIDFYVARSL